MQVVNLSSFMHYESDACLLALGGLALLPRRLSTVLRPALERCR
jgi:hypothetical protein